MIRVCAVGKRDRPLPGRDAAVRVSVGRSLSQAMNRKSYRAPEEGRSPSAAPESRTIWRRARTGPIACVMNRFFLFLAALLLGATPAAADILVDNVNGYTLREDGRLVRFQAMWIGDDGKVRQLFEAGDRRPARTAFRID